MTRRLDTKAILADPKERKRMIHGAVAFLIAVGEDFTIDLEEAQERASAQIAQENYHD